MALESGNAAVYFVDRHANGPLAAKTAFIEGSNSITYGKLGEETGKMAALYEKHGLRAEDRALMLMLDCIEFPVIFWGSLKCGVVAIPVNTLLSADLYDAIIADCRPRALFVSSELLEVTRPAIEKSPHLKSVFVIGGSDHGYLDFESEIADCETRPAIDVSPDECAFWLCSSGSTGMPKGVRHVHSSLKATSDTYGAKVLGIRQDDVVYSAAKLFFAYGLGNGMSFPMAVGATTVLLRGRPAPDTVLALMAEHKPTIFYGVPTLYAAMLAVLGDNLPEGFENLRISVSAGEALPEEIGKRWNELTGSQVLDGVGSTEMLHIFLSNSPGDVVYGSSGLPVPGYQVRLVDEKGREVADGEIGEMLVNGASAADGYWNQREKSRSTFEGCWTRTGDKYERRPDGRYYYCGRTDDMFKVSGIWVSPFEVEQALIAYPGVLEAAVVAARDDDDLEKPKAFIVLKEGADEVEVTGALKDFVQKKVGKWKYPRWIEVVHDLPKTATGKIQRFKLR